MAGGTAWIAPREIRVTADVEQGVGPAAVNEGKAERDDREADEVLRRQPLVQEDRAKNHCRRRGEKCYEQDVRSVRAGQNAKYTMKASAVENAAIPSIDAIAASLGRASVQGRSMASASGARNTVAVVACPAATSIGFSPRDGMRRA